MLDTKSKRAGFVLRYQDVGIVIRYELWLWTANDCT